MIIGYCRIQVSKFDLTDTQSFSSFVLWQYFNSTQMNNDKKPSCLYEIFYRIIQNT